MIPFRSQVNGLNLFARSDQSQQYRRRMPEGTPSQRQAVLDSPLTTMLAKVELEREAMRVQLQKFGGYVHPVDPDCDVALGIADFDNILPPKFHYMLPKGANRPNAPPWPRFLEVRTHGFHAGVRTMLVRGSKSATATDTRCLLPVPPHPRYIAWPSFVVIVVPDDTA